MKRDNENTTQFTIRCMRNEIIEECVTAVQSEITNVGAGFGWGAWHEDEYKLMINILTKVTGILKDLKDE